MFHKPSPRVRYPPFTKGDRSFLSIRETKQFVAIKEPVYKYDDYKRLLEENNKVMGIPFTDPNLPVIHIFEPVYKYDTYKPIDLERVPVPLPLPPLKEPELEFSDRVQVLLTVLKNGKVRIKTNTSIATLHETYFKKLKQPPLKAILQAYKSHGFSQVFLDTLKVKYEKKQAYTKRIGKIFSDIFERKPVPKRKPKKVKLEVEEEEEEAEAEAEADEEEEEDVLDVEPDEPDEIIEDEEYMSDCDET
jgi:hypothetical protein